LQAELPLAELLHRLPAVLLLHLLAGLLAVLQLLAGSPEA
jgi:hypothetical protein